MLRWLAILILLAGGVVGTHTASSDTYGPSIELNAEQVVEYFAQTQSQIDPSEVSPKPVTCCRVCTKGKACGNSCINRNYTCTKPPGCACNGRYEPLDFGSRL